MSAPEKSGTAHWEYAVRLTGSNEGLYLASMVISGQVVYGLSPMFTSDPMMADWQRTRPDAEKQAVLLAPQPVTVVRRMVTEPEEVAV